jgi:hypothetical protein
MLHCLYVIACQMIKAGEEIADQKRDRRYFGVVTTSLVQKKVNCPIIVKQRSRIR